MFGKQHKYFLSRRITNEKVNKIKVLVAIALLGTSTLLMADEAASFSEALTDGKVKANFKLRYENVNQDGRAKTGEALTLRSLVGYETKAFHGFSVNAEVYGVSPIIDDYNDAKKGILSPVGELIL